MGLFKRKPLHVRLAEQGGLVAREEARPAATEAPADLEEQFFGERSIPFWERLSGEIASPRPRRWDAVATVEAELDGNAATFVALPDGSLLVEEQTGDASLDPLARAVEERLSPPYRGRAVRQGANVWAVAANRIRVEQVRAEGDEIDLVVTDAEQRLTVDGEPSFGSVPALERIGQAEGPTYHVRATRLDGDLWEVRASAL